MRYSNHKRRCFGGQIIMCKFYSRFFHGLRPSTGPLLNSGFNYADDVRRRAWTNRVLVLSWDIGGSHRYKLLQPPVEFLLATNVRLQTRFWSFPRKAVQSTKVGYWLATKTSTAPAQNKNRKRVWFKETCVCYLGLVSWTLPAYLACHVAYTSLTLPAYLDCHVFISCSQF